MSDAWRYAVWPDPRSRSRALKSWKSISKLDRAQLLTFILVFVSRDFEVGKDKAMSHLKLEIRPFLTAISSAIHIGSWQLSVDS